MILEELEILKSKPPSEGRLEMMEKIHKEAFNYYSEKYTLDFRIAKIRIF